MNANDRNTITKWSTLVGVFALAALAVLPATVFGGGHEEQITGAVFAISDTDVTVKTTDAKLVVVVAFNKKTTFVQDSKPIRKAEIKVGNHIVIHAVEVDRRPVARTVEIEAASTTQAKK